MAVFILFEANAAQALKTVLFAMPETAGTLAFGISLVVAAVFIRWFMARDKQHQRDK
ncbi:MAG: hypothetical protein ABIV48_08065 [Pyrinomonadaceae bacterium]